MTLAQCNIYAQFTQSLASLSKCTDKHTAAIAVSEDGQQVYSIGINGGPIGGIQCLCTLGGKYTCIHAEANCIAKCNAADKKKVMFCTLSPCVTCAAMIINSGFSSVYYIDDYKDFMGLEMLQEAGIQVMKLGGK